jgi:hypothetical protein
VQRRGRGANVPAAQQAGTGIAAAAAHLRENQKQSAFDTEMNSYLLILSKMTQAQLLGHNPLLFWARHAQALPILARLARRFLAPAPTSCSVEEFFSVVGKICSPTRSRLSPVMLESLSCLHGWKRVELGYSDARVTKRLKTAERFATLSISLEIVSPEQVDDTEIELQEDLTEDLAEEEEGDEDRT